MMMIEKKWEDFCAGAGLAEAPEQVKEQWKTIFYAGVAASFKMVAEACTDGAPSREVVDGLLQELQEYFSKGSVQ